MKTGLAEAVHTARNLAGMTLEHAAECVGVSSRSISNYESGRTVPDQIIACMVKAYRNPGLGFYYLTNELYTGRLLLPPIIPAGVSSKSIRLRVAVEHVKALLPELDAICLDDFVDEAERGTLAGNIGKFRELASACLGIQMMAGFYANEKGALAATRTPSRKSLCD